MRFVIQNRTWNAQAPYRLSLAGATIRISRPVFSGFKHDEMRWRWIDAVEYRLLYPIQCDQEPVQITSHGQVKCEGRLVVPFAGMPRIEWQLRGETLTAHSGWRSGKLVSDSQKRRLAFWVNRWCLTNGVCRYLATDADAPLIFGIILAAISGPD
jgi:hypothetical protein